MATSGTALQRIALVERSYTRLVEATRQAINDQKLPHDDPLIEQVVLLGQEIAGWKTTATALAYKSPWDAESGATEKLRLVHRYGAQLAQRTGGENPTFDPSPLEPGSSSSAWTVIVAVGVAALVAYLVWRVAR